MPNNPNLHYKPGLTMDAPVSVTLAAADWVAFMTWVSGPVDVDGVSHLLYGPISEQIIKQLYSPASVKAAEAKIEEMTAERHAANPFHQILKASGIMRDFPTAEEFAEAHPREVWVMRCAECGLVDEYPPNYAGSLTCGHNGSRELIDKKSYPPEGQ